MIILLQLIIANALYCQVYFNERFNYSAYTNADIAKSALEHESGYYVAGMTGAYYIAVCNIDYLGKIKWTKTWGRPNEQHWLGNPGSFISTKDGGYAMFGTYKDSLVKASAIFMKFDSNMDTSWTKICYDTINQPPIYYYYYFQGIENRSNGYALCGVVHPYGGPQHVLLIITDTLGEVVHKRTFGNSIKYYQGHSIINTDDGGYAIGGFVFEIDNDYSGDPIVIKTDSLGNQEWVKNLGGPNQDNKAMICNSADNKIIIGTNYADFMSGDEPYTRTNLIKLDNLGNIIWNYKYGESSYRKYLLNIRSLDNGDIIATGTVGSIEPWRSGWILKVDVNGDSLWYREYALLNGDNSMNFLYDVIVSKDQGILACGYIWPSLPDTGSQDAWVIKLDSIGCEYPFCDTTVGVDEITGAEKNGLLIYPNPASNIISCRFKACPEQSRGVGDFRLVVYDLFGRKAEEIVVPPWQENVRIDVSRWNTGVYIAVLWDENGVVGREKFVVAH